MKTNIISHLGMIVLCVGTSHGAVIISKTVGNGGFVHGSTGNFSSITGWTTTNTFFVSGTNSSLTTTPFGVDDTTNSRSVVLGHDSGSVTTSTTLFSVGAGEIVNLSFDLRTEADANPVDVTLTGMALF